MLSFFVSTNFPQVLNRSFLMFLDFFLDIYFVNAKEFLAPTCGLQEYFRKEQDYRRGCEGEGSKFKKKRLRIKSVQGKL